MNKRCEVQGLYPNDEHAHGKYWFLLAKVLLANKRRKDDDFTTDEQRRKQS